MHGVLEDLNLEKLFVVYPGERGYPLGEKIQTLPLDKSSEALEWLNN